MYTYQEWAMKPQIHAIRFFDVIGLKARIFLYSFGSFRTGKLGQKPINFFWQPYC